MNYFNFSDNGLELQIKTDCSHDSQSKDDQTPQEWMKHVLGNGTHFNLIKKSFRFCQNGFNCCSTGALPVENQRCKQTNYKAYELGGCGKFDFDLKKLYGGDITLHGPNEGQFYKRFTNLTFFDLTQAKDAWTPEWVRLVLGNGAVIKCSFNETMVCKPEGKISFVLGILICTVLPHMVSLLDFFLFSK